MNIERPSFESQYNVIIAAIRKRKRKWYNSVNWMDFDDIEMTIANHVYTKWHLYDPKYPFINWLNRVITYQFHNILRDNTKHNLFIDDEALSGQIRQKNLSNLSKESIDFDLTLRQIQSAAKSFLTPQEYKVFDLIYIQNKPDAEVIVLLGYKISKTASGAYNKTLKTLKDSITKKITRAVRAGDISIVTN